MVLLSIKELWPVNFCVVNCFFFCMENTILFNKKLAIYLPSFPSGGIERLYLNLASVFLESGLTVTFVVDRAEGTLLADVPKGVGIVEFGSKKCVIRSRRWSVTFVGKSRIFF